MFLMDIGLMSLKGGLRLKVISILDRRSRCCQCAFKREREDKEEVICNASCLLLITDSKHSVSAVLF